MEDWQVAGRNVVCIFEASEWGVPPDMRRTLPIKGEVYTLAEVAAQDDEIGFRLIGIPGPKNELFSSRGFRPAKATTLDLVMRVPVDA